MDPKVEDGKLVEKVLGGDRSAFEPLLDRLTFRYGDLHPGNRTEFRPVSRTLRITETEPAADLEIIFVEGLRLTGRVRNTSGQPLPHAQTTWRFAGAPAARISLKLRGIENPFLRLEVRTDSSGAHTFPRLPPGEYRVKVSSEYNGAGVEERFQWGPGVEAVELSLGGE